MPASPAPSTDPAPDGLDALLGRFEPVVPPVSIAGAAVTIVLREGVEEVETLLIERATNPDDPASGEVALPGGHVSDGDGSLTVTAIRELEEEVGLTEGDLAGPLRYVGNDLAARFHLKVAVFAARLSPMARPPTIRSADEVAHVFWLPRSALESTRRVSRETSGVLTEVNATVFEGHVLWGFTRRVLRQFFGLPTTDELVGPVFPQKRLPSI